MLREPITGSEALDLIPYDDSLWVVTFQMFGYDERHTVTKTGAGMHGLLAGTDTVFYCKEWK